MKEQFTQMKKSGVTNPAKEVFVSTSVKNEFSEYVKKANSFKTLTAEEEKEFAQRAKAGDESAKKILVQSNLKLVLTIARKVIHVSKSPFVDLIQE